MDGVLDIVVTREDANSDYAMLVSWLVEDRVRVREDQPICVIETTKAVTELVAPAGGVLVRLQAEGTEVAFGTRIALVAEDEHAAEQAAERAMAGPHAVPVGATQDDAAPPVEGAAARISRPARRLAEQHGLDLQALAARGGFIGTEEVEALLRGREDVPVAAFPGSDRVCLGGVTLPAVLAGSKDLGRLDPAFYEEIRRDPGALAELPSGERIARYREHGAEIGDGVRLGRRTVLVAPRIVLGAESVIGDDGTVRCEEAFLAGRLVQFGPRLELTCRFAAIGDGTYAGRDIRVGGGGRFDPWASLVLGDGVFLGDELFMNPCRPIVIGREAFVTQRTMMVTHNIGHSVLEGFENRFAPIVVEDRAQVGMATVVYAGARIGREATIGSGSYVVSGIPSGKLAMGCPARVVGDARRRVDSRERARIAREMVQEFRELLSAKSLRVEETEHGTTGFTVHDGSARRVLLLAEDGAALPVMPGEGAEEVVVWQLGGPVDGQRAPATCRFDLVGRQVAGDAGRLAEASREFLRKRGIRVEPGPWRYGGGLL